MALFDVNTITKSYALLDDDTLLGEVVEAWGPDPPGSPFRQDRKLVYRRRLYLPGSAMELEADGATDDSHAALKIAYDETRHHLQEGLYPVPAEQMVPIIAAQLQVANGDFNTDDWPKGTLRSRFGEFIAAETLKKCSRSLQDKLEAATLAQYASLAGTSKVDAMKQVVASVKSLVPAYGAFFFAAQCNRPLTDKLRKIQVAIGWDGITLFITRRGKLYVESIKYADIAQWSVLKDGSMFAFWINDGANNDTVALMTDEAAELDKLVQAYVAENIAVLDGADRTATRARGAPSAVPTASGAASASGGAGGDAPAGGGKPLEALGEEGEEDEEDEDDDGDDTDNPESQAEAAARKAGWELHVDEAQGVPFWYHPERDESSWTVPAVSADGTSRGDGKSLDALAAKVAKKKADDVPIPDGWTQKVDPATGKVFYQHTATSRTTMMRPTSSKPPPAAPPAPSGKKKPRRQSVLAEMVARTAEPDAPPLPAATEAPEPEDTPADAAVDAAGDDGDDGDDVGSADVDDIGPPPAEEADAAGDDGGEQDAAEEVEAAEPEDGDVAVDGGEEGEEVVEGEADDAERAPGEDDGDDEVQWWYRDDDGNPQGPFGASQLLEWFSAGYFEETVMLLREGEANETDWKALNERWSDTSQAFLD